MNTAIIGLGYWGKNYLRILGSNTDIKLVAVVEPNPDFTIDKEIRNFNTVEELLNSEINIDAAVVCTPTKSHYEIFT